AHSSWLSSEVMLLLNDHLSEAE
ncbi:hypothetical protein A2U01_0083815, partial [Trifolium medium]|nr:hypothetical protein [Trifolium medium]